MRILVTGSSGGIGRKVVKELAAHGHTVRAIDQKGVAADHHVPGVEYIYADIADPFAMLSHVAGCDAIVHTAAYPDPRVVTSELFRVNVTGTQNILEAAEANGVSRVIITSSIGALGFSFPTTPCLPDYLPVDAAHPRRPQDPYGLSKVMNEESAAMTARRSGMTVIVFRPPWVIDLERAKYEGWLKHMAARRETRRDTGLWAYVDVTDLARAYRLALEATITGYHVFYPIANDICARLSPLELVTQHLPEMIAFVDRLTDNSFYDVATIREQIGWESERSIQAVLAEAAAEQ